jgi:Zn-dependent M28 family amino/carboxypeptidase
MVFTMLWIYLVFPGELPAFYPAISVEVASLRETVEYLSTLNPPRNYYNLNSLDKSANYIFERMTEIGLTPEYQEYYAGGNRYRNVIGYLGPIDAPVVVIGAHYDVAGDQPGADDNASAVAGLLETVRLLVPFSNRLNVRIVFISWCLEEPPFFGKEEMGSYVHAKSLSDEHLEIIGAISLEMIGYFTEQPKSQKYPLGLMGAFYPDKGNFIAVVGNLGSGSLVKTLKKHMKQASIEVITLTAPGWFGGIDLSDHRNYWKFGYKAAMITDTAHLRNPNYHTKNDTIETLDFVKMAEVIKGVVWSLLNIR